MSTADPHTEWMMRPFRASYSDSPERVREREVDAAVRADMVRDGLDPANGWDAQYYLDVIESSGFVSPSLLRAWREQHV